LRAWRGGKAAGKQSKKDGRDFRNWVGGGVSYETKFSGDPHSRTSEGKSRGERGIKVSKMAALKRRGRGGSAAGPESRAARGEGHPRGGKKGREGDYGPIAFVIRR